MTRHTLQAYQNHLEELTGLLCDIVVYDETNHEQLGAWMENTEVAQFPDLIDTRDMATHIPEGLLLASRNSEAKQLEFETQLNVLKVLQSNQRLLEHVLTTIPHLKENVEHSPVSEPRGDPLAVSRRVRGCIATIIWNANPFLLEQIRRVTGAQRAMRMF